MRAQGVEPGTITQNLLERYHEQRGFGLEREHAFVRWLHHTRVNTNLRMHYVPTPSPTVTVSDVQRWDAVELLLHDQTLRLYTRVAGLFLLLFAQPLTQVVRMRTDQVNLTAQAITVRFHTVPIQMPPILDTLLREQLEERGKSLYASRHTGWLFPGGIPGRHLATENIRAQLVAAASSPTRTARQLCSNSPATSPPPSWPTSSA